MRFFNSTHKWSNYWKHRKNIDWKTAYLDTWKHPHRFIISGILKTLPWLSLFEIGCGSGANLMNIVKIIGGKQVGGIDVNEKAIELANKTFDGGIFKVGYGDDIMLSDKSTDVVLSDMCLIYVDPSKIDKYLNEIKRIGRKYVLLCEFHSESFWKRIKLRFTSGYYAYNYKKLLEKHDFYDILSYRLRLEDWPGGEPQKSYGWIFLASIPKRS